MVPIAVSLAPSTASLVLLLLESTASLHQVAWLLAVLNPALFNYLSHWSVLEILSWILLSPYAICWSCGRVSSWLIPFPLHMHRKSPVTNCCLDPMPVLRQPCSTWVCTDSIWSGNQVRCWYTNYSPLACSFLITFMTTKLLSSLKEQTFVFFLGHPAH